MLVFCSIALGQDSKPLDAKPDAKNGVLRGKGRIEIVGTVVAHDQENGWPLNFEGGYIDTLVVRIEKGLKGRLSGHFVRADFLGWSGTNDLPKSLFMGRQWKMTLEPVPAGEHYSCAWTVRPPGPGELTVGVRVVPVGGATAFPDVNTLPCYVLKRKNVQEITLGDKE
jgi:hypothetical protein